MIVPPLQPVAIKQRPPQDEFDLRIQAAQIVICPALDRFQHGRVDAEKEGFALGHGVGVNLVFALMSRAGKGEHKVRPTSAIDKSFPCSRSDERRARRTGLPANC